MRVIIDTDPAMRLAGDLVAYLRTFDGAHLAVSGGSTPRALFRILASQYRNALDWGRVTVWQVDERCVPPDDPQSNWKMLSDELLSRISNLKSHRIEAERAGAAEDYGALLRAHVAPAQPGPLAHGDDAARGHAHIPRLDLVVLGMGADGHTASLFPGTAALDESARTVVYNDVPQLGTGRVTMTLPLINAARRRWFLVAGADKAGAFARVRAGELPAAGIRDAVWYIDPAVSGG